MSEKKNLSEFELRNIRIRKQKLEGYPLLLQFDLDHFANNDQLQTIKIKNNEKILLDENVFRNLKRLKELQLTGTKLTKLL